MVLDNFLKVWWVNFFQKFHVVPPLFTLCLPVVPPLFTLCLPVVPLCSPYACLSGAPFVHPICLPVVLLFSESLVGEFFSKIRCGPPLFTLCLPVAPFVHPMLACGPPFVHHMLACGAPFVHPICLPVPCGPPFDQNFLKHIFIG